jgi:hypothetical protein
MARTCGCSRSAGFTTVPAFFHDVAISSLRIRSFTILEHASAFGTVLVSWMLLEALPAHGR